MHDCESGRDRSRENRFQSASSPGEIGPEERPPASKADTRKGNRNNPGAESSAAATARAPTPMPTMAGTSSAAAAKAPTPLPAVTGKPSGGQSTVQLLRHQWHQRQQQQAALRQGQAWDIQLKRQLISSSSTSRVEAHQPHQRHRARQVKQPPHTQQ